MSIVEIWNWAFLGFETSQGNRPVQNWFDGLSVEEQDEARDTLGYYEHLPIQSWGRPGFSPLDGGISEIRFWTPAEFRIYGYFGPIRRSYVFLHGTGKKVKNDKKGKATAKDRKGQLERNEARTHGFKFSKQSD